MAETIYSIEQDLSEAQAMADALVPYIYEDQLYGNASGGGAFSASKLPSLTVGALLLRLRRLHALEDHLTDAQRAQLAAIDTRHENVHKEWTVHYQNKLTQEADSRLKAMNHYFEECRENPRTCANAYLPEALRRTIVQEIVGALERGNVPSTEVRKAAGNADSGLRHYVKPSDFIWATQLESVYPKSTFWWLYSRPPQPE